MRGVCLSISFQLRAREMRRTNLRSAGATAGENRDLSRLRSTHHGRKDMHPFLEEKHGIRAQLRITTILTKCYSRLINSLREQSRQRLNEKGQYTPADGKKFCKATVSELQVCCLDSRGENLQSFKTTRTLSRSMSGFSNNFRSSLTRAFIWRLL